MTSVTAQNVSSVAAASDTSSAQKANVSQRQVSSVPTNQEVRQIMQISSAASAVQVKIDKDRAPEVPKKTESPYSSQEEKDESQPKKQTKGAKKPNSEHVDVLA